MQIEFERIYCGFHFDGTTLSVLDLIRVNSIVTGMRSAHKRFGVTTIISLGIPPIFEFNALVDSCRDQRALPARHPGRTCSAVGSETAFVE